MINITTLPWQPIVLNCKNIKFKIHKTIFTIVKIINSVYDPNNKCIQYESILCFSKLKMTFSLLKCMHDIIL